jgi:hypothetical protein
MLDSHRHALKWGNKATWRGGGGPSLISRVVTCTPTSNFPVAAMPAWQETRSNENGGCGSRQNLKAGRSMLKSLECLAKGS